jgi:hypothetical protein
MSIVFSKGTSATRREFHFALEYVLGNSRRLSLFGSSELFVQTA